ncbi:hypothetical protein D8B29_01785 [Verminephrobacter eiseniae]|nr:hypothetical protein [Verminephrobacter eiseniae]MCW5301450.1 hypothetical protein [Verminephrobacter eiseniae]MCW8178412.1 hypothetical protein [Verminephrobacter eiseniae]MCW8190559.1 hypothetical protein [Verminephrobacter eiseniae]
MPGASRASADGARSIETQGVRFAGLCDGFGPVGTATVLWVIDGMVPAGSVGQGSAPIAVLKRLFAT